MQVLGACILLAAGARAPAAAAGPGAAVVEILEPQGGGTVHEVCSETGQAPISVRFRVASAVAAAAAVDALAITVLVDGNEHSSITVAEDERVRAQLRANLPVQWPRGLQVWLGCHTISVLLDVSSQSELIWGSADFCVSHIFPPTMCPARLQASPTATPVPPQPDEGCREPAGGSSNRGGGLFPNAELPYIYIYVYMGRERDLLVSCIYIRIHTYRR